MSFPPTHAHRRAEISVEGPNPYQLFECLCAAVEQLGFLRAIISLASDLRRSGCRSTASPCTVILRTATRSAGMLGPYRRGCSVTELD